MKTITKQTTVTTERGTVLNMTVTAKRGWEKTKEVSYCDGDNVEVESMKKVKETIVSFEISGVQYNGQFGATGNFVPVDLKKQGVYALFSTSKGGQIAMSERVYNELNAVIESAIKESETDENWLKYQKQIEESLKQNREYEQAQIEIDNMMTLNGKTY